jgi:ribosome modulation factor
MIGTKEKDGKTVPNCVKKTKFKEWIKENSEEIENPLKIAYQQGKSAMSEEDCPYPYSNRVQYAWIDGFVDKCAEDRTDRSSSMYVKGRVAYRLGKRLTDIPETEHTAGRWVSGWMVEKDRQR